MQPNEAQPPASRSIQLLRFLSGCLWLFAASTLSSHAAQGFATRLNLPVIDPLLQQSFFLLLVLVGFTTLQWLSTRHGSLRSANALPTRPTSVQEFSRGAALGWATLLLAICPMMLAGALHPDFSLTLRTWALALLSILTVALSTLALEAAFRGYLFARLIQITNPTAATLLLSLAYAALSSLRPYSTLFSMFLTFLTGILFSMAYLRTHALWLGWGLHFGWNAAMAILFGLPIAGYTTDNTLVSTAVSGPRILTGGAYGPEAALFTLIALPVAMIFLHRLTRTYAWDYTHAPIVPAGYAVVIAPPAAHTAMEASAAAAPAPLIQILTTTPTASSTLPAIDEHLRRESIPDPDHRVDHAKQ